MTGLVLGVAVGFIGLSAYIHPRPEVQIELTVCEQYTVVTIRGDI